MGFLDFLAGGTVKAIGQVADDLITTDKERAEAAFALERLASRERRGQMQVNRAEAKSRNVWVAGWRPAVGWTCAVGLAWTLFANLVAAVTQHFWALELQPPDAGLLYPVLMGMLGLGGLRTFEKHQGLTQ